MSHAADESDDAAVPPLPWHERLQARLADVERAAAALLAVCEEPDAAATLEARYASDACAPQRTLALSLPWQRRVSVPSCR